MGYWLIATGVIKPGGLLVGLSNSNTTATSPILRIEDFTNKNNPTGRITRKKQKQNKKNTLKNKKNKKTTRKQPKKNKTWIVLSFLFVFCFFLFCFLFFIVVGFLFCLFALVLLFLCFIFSMKPYILCAVWVSKVGFISLSCL